MAAFADIQFKTGEEETTRSKKLRMLVDQIQLFAAKKSTLSSDATISWDNITGKPATFPPNPDTEWPFTQITGEIQPGQVPLDAVQQYQSDLEINYSQIVGTPPGYTDARAVAAVGAASAATSTIRPTDTAGVLTWDYVPGGIPVDELATGDPDVLFGTDDSGNPTEILVGSGLTLADGVLTSFGAISASGVTFDDSDTLYDATNVQDALDWIDRGSNDQYETAGFDQRARIAAGGMFADSATVQWLVDTGDGLVQAIVVGGSGGSGGQGPPGVSGIDGQDGEEGQMGPPGPPGTPGGPPGPTGATGPSGPQGPYGGAGADGEDGEDGQSIPGPIGPKGATGPGGVGAPGMNGEDGVDGDSGPPGMAGSAGPSGATGPAGPPGPQGEDGPIGDDGPPGASGATGATGSSGSQGLPGPPGMSGEDGNDADQIIQIFQGGALVKLAEQVLSGSASTITFSAIPQGFRSLVMRITADGTTASPELLIQFNGDTGSHYSGGIFFGGSSTASTMLFNQTAITLNAPMPANSFTNAAMQAELVMHDYAGKVFNKNLSGVWQRHDATTTAFFGTLMGTWFPASPTGITSILLSLSAGSFLTGSVFSLYAEQ